MPPKAPNLKFKPKLVSQQRSQTGGAAPEYDELSTVQLERLRRQQEGEADAPTTAPGVSVAASAAASGTDHSLSGAQATPASGHTTRARGQTSTGAVSSTAPATGAASSASAAPTAASSPTVRKSAAAQLHEATGRYFDLAQYREHADPLPVNTINDILGEGERPEDALEGQPRIYRPIPISTQGVAAAAASQAIEVGPVATVPKDAETDGVAFLRGAEAEFQRACAANMRFMEEKLLRGSEEEEGEEQKGHLTWMQLPRFHGPNAACSLQDLPPGKVGELKLLRSGRMVLEMAGVYYEVWMGGDDGTAQEGHAGAPSQDSFSTVVVTQPKPQPVQDGARASCYEVGAIEKKLVCVPTVQERV